MNNKLYRETFSDVHPSEKAIERVINMTEKKQKRYSVRIIAVITAVISVLMISGIAVNAVTDGAIKDGIAYASESIAQKIKLIFNGKEVEASDLPEFEKGVVDDIIKDLPENDEDIYIQVESDEENRFGIAVASVDSTAKFNYSVETQP